MPSDQVYLTLRVQIEWIVMTVADSLSDIECTDDVMQACAVATFTELDVNNSSMSAAHAALQAIDLGISVWGARCVGNFISCSWQRLSFSVITTNVSVFELSGDWGLHPQAVFPSTLSVCVGGLSVALQF